MSSGMTSIRAALSLHAFDMLISVIAPPVQNNKIRVYVFTKTPVSCSIAALRSEGRTRYAPTGLYCYRLLIVERIRTARLGLY